MDCGRGRLVSERVIALLGDVAVQFEGGPRNHSQEQRRFSFERVASILPRQSHGRHEIQISGMRDVVTLDEQEILAVMRLRRGGEGEEEQGGPDDSLRERSPRERAEAFAGSHRLSARSCSVNSR
jgi:hypothetical protein